MHSAPQIDRQLALLADAAACEIEDPVLRSQFLAAATGAASLDTLHELFKWRERPVPMVEFIESPAYLNQRGQVWPGVIDVCVEVAEGDFDQVVLTGGTSWGKSTTAKILQSRSVYEISCLADAHNTLGLMRHSPIVFVQQSITEKKARKVLFDELSQMLRQSPWFREHCLPHPRVTSALLFPNGIRVDPIAGTATAALGENVIGAAISELNFMATVIDSARSRGDIYDQATALYEIVARRMRTRFLERGRQPSWLILDSSAGYPGDFTEKKAQEAKTDPHIYVANLPTWQTRPVHSFSSGATFRVDVGSEVRTPRILADDEAPEADADIVAGIPADYRPDFEKDIDGALRDIAGRSTLALLPYIRDRKAIADLAVPGRQHPFTTEWTTLREPPGSDGACELIESALDLAHPAPRVIHLDLAETGDAAGLCMAYVDGLVDVERTAMEVVRAERALDAEGLTEKVDRDGKTHWFQRLPIIVVEAVLQIRPAPNDEIRFEAIVALILRLADVGIPIAFVSADGFQSTMPLQMLYDRGISTDVLSVDRTPQPYEDCKAALMDRRYRGYAHPVLTRELAALERHEKTQKIDHPRWTVDADGERVRGSKDLSDGLAATTHVLTRYTQFWATRADERPALPRPDFYRGAARGY